MTDAPGADRTSETFRATLFIGTALTVTALATSSARARASGPLEGEKDVVYTRDDRSRA